MIWKACFFLTSVVDVGGRGVTDCRCCERSHNLSQAGMARMDGQNLDVGQQ